MATTNLDSQYIEYLKSDQWSFIRNQKLRETGLRCQACGCIYNDSSCLEIHHTHYENFQNESLSDLVALCLLCHDVIGLIRKMRKIEYQIEDPVRKKAELSCPFNLQTMYALIMLFLPDFAQMGVNSIEELKEREMLYFGFRNFLMKGYDFYPYDCDPIKLPFKQLILNNNLYPTAESLTSVEVND